MWPQLFALERKAKNDPGLKAYFWSLEPRQKDRSSIIKNS